MPKTDLNKVIEKRKKALRKQLESYPKDAPTSSPERAKKIQQLQITRKHLKRAQRQAARIKKLQPPPAPKTEAAAPAAVAAAPAAPAAPATT